MITNIDRDWSLTMLERAANVHYTLQWYFSPIIIIGANFKSTGTQQIMTRQPVGGLGTMVATGQLLGINVTCQLIYIKY